MTGTSLVRESARSLRREDKSRRRGKHPVEHDKVGEDLGHQRMGCVGVWRTQRTIARMFYIDGQQFGYRRLVFHNQHACWH